MLCYLSTKVAATSLGLHAQYEFMSALAIPYAASKSQRVETTSKVLTLTCLGRLAGLSKKLAMRLLPDFAQKRYGTKSVSLMDLRDMRKK